MNLRIGARILIRWKRRLSCSANSALLSSYLKGATRNHRIHGVTSR